MRWTRSGDWFETGPRSVSSTNGRTRPSDRRCGRSRRPLPRGAPSLPRRGTGPGDKRQIDAARNMLVCGASPPNPGSTAWSLPFKRAPLCHPPRWWGPDRPGDPPRPKGAMAPPPAAEGRQASPSRRIAGLECVRETRLRGRWPAAPPPRRPFAVDLNLAAPPGGTRWQSPAMSRPCSGTGLEVY